MNYLHFLDHLGIEQRNIVKQNGFILPSLLISVTISSFVILMLVMICMTCFILTERIDDSLAMLEDGRYTRRAIVAHIIWNSSMTSVNEDGHILSIKDDKHTTFTVVRRALYRKLSDGSLQPLSGSRIIGTDDKRKVDGIQPFSMSTNKLLVLNGSLIIDLIVERNMQKAMEV